MSRISISLALYLIFIYWVLHSRPACCFDENGDLPECHATFLMMCLGAGVASYFVGLSVSNLKIVKK